MIFKFVKRKLFHLTRIGCLQGCLSPYFTSVGHCSPRLA